MPIICTLRNFIDKRNSRSMMTRTLDEQGRRIGQHICRARARLVSFAKVDLLAWSSFSLASLAVLPFSRFDESKDKQIDLFPFSSLARSLNRDSLTRLMKINRKRNFFDRVHRCWLPNLLPKIIKFVVCLRQISICWPTEEEDESTKWHFFD